MSGSATRFRSALRKQNEALTGDVGPQPATEDGGHDRGAVAGRSDQAALIRPSWVSAVTPSSRPISSAILPLITFSTVVPVKCILRPVAAGRAPIKKSLKAGPVCEPPPSH